MNRDEREKNELNTKGILNGKSAFGVLIAALILIIILAITVSVSIGQVGIPLERSYQILVSKITGISFGDYQQASAAMYENVIWLIRFPRVLMALLVGAGLAVCGTVIQASVQNPLADPYILGISSGASLGATFAILLGSTFAVAMGSLGIAFWAFAGAVGASLLVMLLSSLGGKMSSVKLVLAGTVVNALCSAFSNFIVFIANDSEGIKTITFWTMGSMASAKWEKLPLLAVVVVIISILFIFQARIMNTMLLGEDAAVTLGVNLNFYRRVYLILTSVLTGIIVSNCGIIGFVGLIIPHITRAVVGADHRKTIPVSILAGALFMVLADLAARAILKNSELPIGILTAIIGAPMFMYMLIKKNYGFGGK